MSILQFSVSFGKQNFLSLVKIPCVLSKQICVIATLFYLPLSRETYNTLTTWLTDARTLASPNIVIILLGNKKDLDGDREVTFLEASRFAQENGKYLFQQISFDFLD